VDDAIVVIENVERWVAMGYEAREATIKGMEEVTGPVIAVALVLCSVFVPTAFIAGITGQFYRQFALTIAASTIISALNALTLTPSRCVPLFRARQRAEHAADAAGDGQAKHGAREGGHTHHAGEALPKPGIVLMVGLAAAWFGGPALESTLAPMLRFVPAAYR